MVGAHAASDITYHLGGNCRSVSAEVGVDDESTAGGSAVFRIYRDAALVADRGVGTASDPPVRLTADLTGGRKLRLVVTDAGDGIDHDHADGAAPELVCT
ncbi:NPCBM/NEW2 domain-containing protein [Streptomyces sp. NPDC002187]|uniref:NPCBM/NEW2 domain-containing protein n=1 Tax=Streptomyces sp. NPDC002187 TaxID=3364637 RepID=UPI003680B041